MVEPIGLLMWEHRLIEKIVPSMTAEADRIAKTEKVDTGYIEKVVDFLRIYADKTHHGKEEDILFAKLESRKLLPAHERVMEELIQEHTVARSRVKGLVEANTGYMGGDGGQWRVVVDHLRGLADLYPRHIEKEDKSFFLPVMDYFSVEERNDMLAEFERFDMAMIHWKYQQVIKNLTGEIVPIRIQPI